MPGKANLSCKLKNVFRLTTELQRSLSPGAYLTPMHYLAVSLTCALPGSLGIWSSVNRPEGASVLIATTCKFLGRTQETKVSSKPRNAKGRGLKSPADGYFFNSCLIKVMMVEL